MSTGMQSTNVTHRTSPGLQELVEWIANDGGRYRDRLQLSSRQQAQLGGRGLEGWMASESLLPCADQGGVGRGGVAFMNVLDNLVATTTIRNAVRLQPLGYKPGTTGGRVGLLGGLRTENMDKYDEVRAF